MSSDEKLFFLREISASWRTDEEIFPAAKSILLLQTITIGQVMTRQVLLKKDALV